MPGHPGGGVAFLRFPPVRMTGIKSLGLDAGPSGGAGGALTHRMHLHGNQEDQMRIAALGSEGQCPHCSQFGCDWNAWHPGMTSLRCSYCGLWAHVTYDPAQEDFILSTEPLRLDRYQRDEEGEADE